MKPKRFKVQTQSSKMYFWVYVYPDIESMRVAATEYAESIGKAEEFEDCYGVCTPYLRQLPPDYTQRHNNVGIIRLSKDHATPRVVSHELVHAAMWMYRLTNGECRNYVWGNANFGPECSDKEERLAHIYCELFADMNRKLYKHGIWHE